MPGTARLRTKSQGSGESTASIKRSLKSMMEKLKRTVRQVAREALDDSDTDYEWGTVSNMFVEKSSNKHAEDNLDQLHERYTQENRLSSNSETLAIRSETDGELSEAESETNGESCNNFENFDATLECEKLRSQKPEGLFIQGPELWEKRRKLWLKETPSNTLEEAEKSRAAFNGISPKKYGAIYKRLVLEDAHLKQSLNLQDVIKVINAGWVETSKWDRAAKGIP